MFARQSEKYIYLENYVWIGETMSLIDYIRGEYVRGRVIDKYRLKNGNIGLVVEQTGTNKRYHVEFQDDLRGPRGDNFYGLLRDPFSQKTDYLDRLINQNDAIELTVSYSRNPLRKAYRIHSVSAPKPYRTPASLMRPPINPVKMLGY